MYSALQVSLSKGEGDQCRPAPNPKLREQVVSGSKT